MKQIYECPETELITVTVADNFFSTGEGDPVHQSDQGMQSYDPGEVW